MSLRGWLLEASIPLSKAIGHIRPPYSIKLTTGLDYRAAKARLDPGEILLTKTYGEFSNLLIPGSFKHAAIYVGDGWVVEANSRGVVKEDLAAFILKKDLVAIYTPEFATYDDMELAAEWALSNVGSPYDYSFNGDNEAFYCSELVAYSYIRTMGDACPFIARPRLGQMTIIPQDIANAKGKWTEVWVSGSSTSSNR